MEALEKKCKKCKHRQKVRSTKARCAVCGTFFNDAERVKHNDNMSIYQKRRYEQRKNIQDNIKKV